MYEMNMDEAEKVPWVCKLGVLRIRIRGLDTKAKIERVIQLWLKERSNKLMMAENTKSRKKSKKDEDKTEGVDTNGDGGETDGHSVVKDIDSEYPKDGPLSSIADDDTSTEARVVRHLKLKQLHTV
ncbi:hypothetical protein BGX34_012013 [Mortierella sp. NVP85]|nr:hypothetical protein BGX34_012013 [Mortierella sp. NVP85]